MKNKSTNTLINKSTSIMGTLFALIVLLGSGLALAREEATWAPGAPGAPTASSRQARGHGTGNENEYRNESGNLTRESLTPEEIATVKSGTEDACVALLRQKFPQVSANALENRCKAILSQKRMRPTLSNRIITKEERDQYKKTIDDEKQAYQDLKAEYEKEHGLFLQYAQAEKDCTTPADCSAAQKKSVDAAKAQLSFLADMIISSLQGLKANVQQSATFTDQEAKDQAARLEANIADVQAAKAKVASSNTKDEVKTAGKDIIGIWHRTELTLKYGAMGILNGNVHATIVQSEALQKRLDAIVAGMDASGKDTKAIQPIIGQFKADIAAAKQDADKAQAMLADPAASNTNVKAAQALLKDARDHLKNANTALREIVKLVNQKGGKIKQASSDEASSAASS